MVAPAAPGDTNLDGLIDILDASDLLSAGRFDLGGQAGWAEGDFNYDGIVDLLDVAESLSTGLFDAGGYAAASDLVAVPEPTIGMATLAIAVGVALIARGRRGDRSGRSPGAGESHTTRAVRGTFPPPKR